MSLLARLVGAHRVAHPALVLRGSFRGTSGHDRHVRAFARQLVASGVAVQLVDLPHWAPSKLSDAQRDPWFEGLDRKVPARAVLHFCMPHQVEPAPGRLTLDFTMFEASRVPRIWIEHNRTHDLVIVPTESSRQAWLASGFAEDRTRICPLGVDGDAFRPDVAPMPLRDRHGGPISAYRTRFLHIGELVPRKNLLGLIATWLVATTAQDDAVLILKLTYGSRGDGVRLLRDIADLERRLGRSRSQAAPIVLLDRLLADHEMPALYAAATHYWSMSFGEGWDLAMSEAAVTGLQLVAPRHSAYLAYLDDSRAWMIPTRQVPARAERNPALAELFAGAHWWEPDQTAAAACISAQVGGREPTKPSARDFLRTNFSWAAATGRLLEILREVHAAHGYPF